MRLVTGVAVLLSAVACGGGEGNGPAAVATQLAFQVQPGPAVAGQPVTPAIQVEFRDASGHAVGAGSDPVTLTITPNPGDAGLAGTSTVNAVSGVAIFADVRVDKPGTGLTLTAGATGLTSATSAAFDVSAAPGVAASIAPVAGDGQSATVGQPVATAPAVQVRDGLGDPVADVAVTFSVSAGDGTVEGAAQTTGADGVATVGGWTLGTRAGANTLAAATPGLPGTVSFAATGTAGPANALLRDSEDDLVASIGSAVADRPSVLVTDAFGNPVADVAVTFAPGPGGGSVTDPSQVSGTDGTATVGSWTLGGSPGPYTLNATSTGLDGSPVVFHATAEQFPMSADVEVHSNFFQSVRNGSGGNPGFFGSVAVDTIGVGGSVTWGWIDSGHNMTPDGNSAFTTSGTHGTPFSFGPITFTAPGTYRYRCTVHSQVIDPLGLVGMRGQIVVR